MEVGQRQVPFELVSPNHVSDHSILTDGHLRWQLVHNLAIWERGRTGNKDDGKFLDLMCRAEQAFFSFYVFFLNYIIEVVGGYFLK